MSHDSEQVAVYPRMGARKIQVSSDLGLHDIMLHLDICQCFIIYDPLVSSMITFSETSLNVTYSFSSNIPSNTADESSGSVLADKKPRLAFVCIEEQPVDEPKIFMLAPGVAFSGLIVTDREKVLITERGLPLDTQSLVMELDEVGGLEAKREKQGGEILQLVQTIGKVNKDDDNQTNAPQLMECIEASTLEMKTRQKEQQANVRQELQRCYEEYKKEVKGRDQQFKALQQEELRLDQRHQAILDELRRQEQQHEEIQQLLHTYKTRDQA